MPLDLLPFRPHPLIRGGHLQTIVGSYWPAPRLDAAELHEVPLPDGDRIALHDDRTPLAGNRDLPGPACSDVVVLVHGLAGCGQSSYMLRCSAKLRARGLRVFRMDLRGCGAGLGLAKHPLHAGRSEDAGAVLAYVHNLAPQARIHLVGFSMGANIVLKLAGELGNSAPAHLASVMGVCPPIDLAACTRSIQQGVNCVYDRRFARLLIKQITARNALVPDAFSRPLVPRPSRLMDFDSLFTSPLAGFADVNDYYARASSGPRLKNIAVPALIVTAASDPIVPVATFKQASYSPTTHVHIAPCGGHMGFVAAAGSDADRRWIDWRVVDWVSARAARTPTTSSLQCREPGRDMQLCPSH
jgi:uncharacterized protein